LLAALELIQIPGSDTTYESLRNQSSTMNAFKTIGAVVSVLIFAFSVEVSADEYSTQWGPTIGEPLPLLEAFDQAGGLRNLDNLVGKEGLLLSLNRSADW
jgi:hypothetical protein